MQLGGKGLNPIISPNTLVLGYRMALFDHCLSAKKIARCCWHRAISVRFLVSANWQPVLYRPTDLGVGGISIIIIVVIFSNNPIHRGTLNWQDYSIGRSLKGEQKILFYAISTHRNLMKFWMENSIWTVLAQNAQNPRNSFGPV